MAGGEWTSQNKVLPGVYINTRSQNTLSPNIGERGTVAIAEPLSWGPTNVVQTIIPGENLVPYIGYDITSAQALFLREMMKGTATTTGPSKILLYRPQGTGGAAASAVIGALTATALYQGVRGNDITIVISADPDNATNDPDLYDVATVVDGAIVNTQSVSNLSQLTANQWVSFSGTGTTITTTAGTALTGGVDPTVAASDYATFLQTIEPHTFDIIAYDGTTSTIMTAFTLFATRMSQSVGRKIQAVMANATTSNSQYVISVNNGVVLSDGTTLTAQQAVWWLAGAEAGAQYNQGLTYANYPGAIEPNPRLTSTQMISAIQSGAIVFFEEFGTTKVLSDINTLTTYSPTLGPEMSKNRVMRVIMQFCNDVYKNFSNYYVGKVDNNDNGRALLKGWIVGYLGEMQANNGVQNFTPDDVTVSPGNSVDAVLINVAIQPVDAVEKIYVNVSVSINTGEEA